MDSRAALPNHTTLSLRDGRTYTILRELGRGGTGIVYDACYTDSVGEQKAVRIKECYPFKCSLRRDLTGVLAIPATEAEAFAQAKEKMLRAYRLGNSFFHTDGLTNFTANTYDLFEANHTLYMVSAYVQGQELSYDSYPSVKDSIAAVRSVANTILKLHNLGYLYLDMKPGNILILNGTTELVQLFDFIRSCPFRKRPAWRIRFPIPGALQPWSCRPEIYGASAGIPMFTASGRCCTTCCLTGCRMSSTVNLMQNTIFQTRSFRTLPTRIS